MSTAGRKFYAEAPNLIACNPEPGWRLRLKFANGVAGQVHLENLLDIGAFKLFRDPRVFATARLDPQYGAVVWPIAGIQLDSSILYHDLRARGVEPLQPGRDVKFQRFLRTTLRRVPLRPKRPPKGSK